MADFVFYIKKENSALPTNFLTDPSSLECKLHSLNEGFGYFLFDDSPLKPKYYYSKDLNMGCLVSGSIFLPETTNRLIKSKFDKALMLEENQLLPYAFELYGNKLGSLLTGSYNLILINYNTNIIHIVSSRFGMAPLYYHPGSFCYVFSTKIHLLVQLGFVDGQLDRVSMLERFIFNYNLSVHTLIKEVFLFSPASYMQVKENSIIAYSRYWALEELVIVDRKKISYNKGIDHIHEAIATSIKKQLSITPNPIISLTGGWDGRLVLSYVEKLNKNFSLFSFGRDNSKDIIIPKMISKALNYEYFPVILDDDYINNSFYNSAIETVYNSDGQRSHLRSHYIYAIRKIRDNSHSVFSGNCGSNIFKFGKEPNYIINDFVHKWLFNGKITQDFKNDITFYLKKFPLFDIENFELQELYTRIDSHYLTENRNLSANQRFYYFLLNDIERKYFGVETNTYNKYATNFTFFMDYDFLKVFSKTMYFGNHFEFYHKSLLHRYNTTNLYAQLIKKNNPRLIQFKSDKGFSLSDALNPLGQLKALITKSLQKNLIRKFNQDNYNTIVASSTFERLLLEKGFINDHLFSKLTKLDLNKRADIIAWIVFSNLLNK